MTKKLDDSSYDALPTLSEMNHSHHEIYSEIIGEDYVLCNVKGKGNCALYSALVGMKSLGCVPGKVFENDDSIVGAVLHTRKGLKEFMITNAPSMWD